MHFPNEKPGTAWPSRVFRLFLVYILHHVLHAALQQAAELVDGVGRYIVAVLHGVEVGQREAQLPQTVRGHALFLHGPEQRFVAYYWQTPLSYQTV